MFDLWGKQERNVCRIRHAKFSWAELGLGALLLKIYYAAITLWLAYTCVW